MRRPQLQRAVPSLGSVVALASGLGLAGCALSNVAGELTPLQCDNGIDDDRDGPWDCADPDCQLFEHCRRLDGSVLGDVVPPRVQPPFDAGPLPPDASRPSLLSDGGLHCPEVACPAGDMCVVGVCVPRQLAVGDEWLVTAIEAAVPRSAHYSTEAPMCVDTDCVAPVSIPAFLNCGCVPDPLVKVYVDGAEVGVTEAAVNVDVQHWNTNIPIILFADSELRFDVLDRDPLADELVYSCAVPSDPTTFGSGSVSCSQIFATDLGDVQLGVVATVSVPPDN